jgi:hypothetical protein
VERDRLAGEHTARRDRVDAVAAGVTVGADSPVLVEHVASAGVRSRGQFRIVDRHPRLLHTDLHTPRLRPGVAAGVILDTEVTATVEAALEVGHVAEALKVTGEPPTAYTRRRHLSPRSPGRSETCEGVLS